MTKVIYKQITIFIVVFCIFGQIATAALSESDGSCCNDNSIQINGQSKVLVQPDIAIVSVGVSNIAKTSQLASQKVADKISQIIQILKKNAIKSEDIKTDSISIYPQYEYPDGKIQLVGQKVSQTLSVTVRKIDRNGGNLGSIIDQLVNVDQL